MISARALFAALLAIAVVVATATDTIPERSHPRAGDFLVLAGDFHVHAFPGDGVLAPWALRTEARRGGLDVVAVTNHNFTWTARLAARLAAGREGPIVIVGEEITHRDHHLIGVGLMRTVDASQSAAAAIADVHRQGGVAIAAHPSRVYWPSYEPALERLDGSEVAHSQIHVSPQARADFAAFHARAAARSGSFAAIGSSDYHGAPIAPGRCRTYLFVRETTALGVLDAIRDGRTVAEDADGKLYGSAELVRILEQQRPAGRVEANRGWRYASLVMAGVAVLGLVLSPARRAGRAAGPS